MLEHHVHDGRAELFMPFNLMLGYNNYGLLGTLLGFYVTDEHKLMHGFSRRKKIYTAPEKN